MAPTNKPIRPIATKPPIAPRNTTAMGTATPRLSRRGFTILSTRATMRHQTIKITAFVTLVDFLLLDPLCGRVLKRLGISLPSLY